MDYERHAVRIPLGQCPPEEVARRLKQHAGIDIDNVPEKYGTSLTDAQELICSKLEISIAYQCFDVASVEEKKVALTNGQCFSGKMAPRILKDASQVVCFVATLAGFNELRDSTPDIMINYFLDTWGTVYAECGQTWVETHLKEELQGSGQRSGYAWGPGQHNFDLLNQKPIFEMLKPDDIGCVLDKHMRMIPFKSTSGIIAVVPDSVPEESDLIPCNFCSFSATCPASRIKK